MFNGANEPKMKDDLGIPVSIGDFVVTWVSGEGVAVKKVDEIVHERVIVDKYTVCHSKIIKVTEQMTFNKKEFPEFFI